MEYNKLVQSKIQGIIKEQGKNTITHVADNEKYKNKLREKLLEELNKFLKDNKVGQRIDIFEVMITINNLNGWDLKKILKLQEQKRKERGSFEKRIILNKIK